MQHPLNIGSLIKFRIGSGSIASGKIIKIDQSTGNYQVEAKGLDIHRNENGELWICDFEVIEKEVEMQNIFVKMTTNKPTKPGTYLLQRTYTAHSNQYRNTRLVDITQLQDSLMVYGLDIDVHDWLDKLPNNWRWSEQPIEIEGDNRKN